MEINEEIVGDDGIMFTKRAIVSLKEDKHVYIIKSVKKHQMENQNNKSLKRHILTRNATDLTFSYKIRVIPLTRAGQPPYNLLQSSTNSFMFTTVNANLFDIKNNLDSIDLILKKITIRQIKIGKPAISVSWSSDNNNDANIIRYVVIKYKPIPNEDDNFHLKEQNLHLFKSVRTLYENKSIELNNLLDLVIF